MKHLGMSRDPHVFGTDFPLDLREGLPDDQRYLLDELPRLTWQEHPRFNGLTAFWIQRHMLFRKLLKVMISDSEDFVGKRLDEADYRERLAQLGSAFVSELHGHHRVEDDQFFPQLEVLEMRLQRGFEMLDRDHHAIDGLLSDFTVNANALLKATGETVLREGVSRFRSDLLRVNSLIERHLTDEEDLVLPIILKHGVG